MTLRLLVSCVLAGWTAGSLGEELYYEAFGSGLAGTIWLEGQGGSDWNPYLSGGSGSNTPAGSAALFHHHAGAYSPISEQIGAWAYYWSRPTTDNVFVAPAWTNEVTVSYDFFHGPQEWETHPYFSGWVQFTDSVTYPDEFFSVTQVVNSGGSTTISETLTYTGDQVVASVKLFQISTKIYNNYPAPGEWIDYFSIAFDNLQVSVSGPDYPLNCADAVAKGYGIPGDLNGDCRVNFADIELLGSAWLNCMIPGKAGCSQPWQP